MTHQAKKAEYLNICTDEFSEFTANVYHTNSVNQLARMGEAVTGKILPVKKRR